MKHLFLLLLGLVFGLTANAQSPYVPDEFVFMILRREPLLYTIRPLIRTVTFMVSIVL